MTRFFRKLNWLRGRPRKENELDDELQFHFEQELEEREAQGLGSTEARFAAGRDLGNVTLLKEDTRSTWTWTLLEQFLQDVHYAGRTMRNNPAFTALAALSLALGIGANTAIYSFMDAILLRSLPVPEPQSLVVMRWHTKTREMHGMSFHDAYFNDERGGFAGEVFPVPAFDLLRRNNSVFSSIFAYQGTGSLNLSIRGQAELAHGEYVSGDYFEGLGIVPSVGRLLGVGDDRAGAAPVAALSFALSQKRFGGPANALGQSILIDNIAFTVVGVTPPEYYGLDAGAVPDLYLPMHSNLLLDAANQYSPPAARYLNPNVDWVEIMARLRPGVSAPQAQAALAPGFYQWELAATSARPLEDRPRLEVVEGRRGLDDLRRTYAKPLYLLMGLVGLILAIACANIANLLLARAAGRRREMAVRLSIGAGRARVIRQLLTESVLLAVAGGAMGVAFAVWGMRVLTLLLANGDENLALGAELNWHILGVAAGLSLLTGILFGLAPAIQSTRADVMPALKEARTGVGRSRSFVRISLSHALVISQIALTLLMLVAAGLFARTLSNLESIEIGFNRENLLTFRLDAQQAGHADSEMASFYTDLRRRFSEIPGVRSVSLSNLPLMGGGRWWTGIAVLGGETKSYKVAGVGPGFFSTMQIPMLLGREIDERDRPGAAMTAVVNQAFAKANFGGANPLGQHLTVPSDCPKCDIQIVGVSRDVRQGKPQDEVLPMVYFAFAQNALGPLRAMYYELRTGGNPLLYANAVREIVHRADARLPVGELATQSTLIDQTINREIAFARLCTAFAALALTIACVGLYGTMSYNVARRTGEIGIRMALGAGHGRVTWMVLREVCVLALAGIAISVPAAWAASKFVEAFLFDMKPNDPLALMAAVGTLGAAALVAGYVPARKAARIDPMVALRHE